MSSLTDAFWVVFGFLQQHSKAVGEVRRRRKKMGDGWDDEDRAPMAALPPRRKRFRFKTFAQRIAEVRAGLDRLCAGVEAGMGKSCGGDCIRDKPKNPGG